MYDMGVKGLKAYCRGDFAACFAKLFKYLTKNLFLTQNCCSSAWNNLYFISYPDLSRFGNVPECPFRLTVGDLGTRLTEMLMGVYPRKDKL